MQEFFDTAVFDMPRSQVIDKLCKLAEETGTAKPEEMRPLISMVTNTEKKNPGTPMNQVCSGLYHDRSFTHLHVGCDHHCPSG